MTDTTDRLRRARALWRWTGAERPPFAVDPEEGQESVWDYPRPPRLEAEARPVEVRLGDVELASTRRALRVLETASPPTVYLPLDDVATRHLEPAAGSSFCEWKGEARYWDIVADGRRIERAAWSYPDPFPEFTTLRDHVAFYPGKVDCHVGPHRVEPQAGGFYGGWVTPELVGPWKGDPGSGGW